MDCGATKGMLAVVSPESAILVSSGVDGGEAGAGEQVLGIIPTVIEYFLYIRSSAARTRTPARQSAVRPRWYSTGVLPIALKARGVTHTTTVRGFPRPSGLPARFQRYPMRLPSFYSRAEALRGPIGSRSHFVDRKSVV